MARTPAQNKATYKYSKEHLKRVPLDMQKADYETLKAHASKTRETVNGFIKRAITETITRDNGSAKTE